MGPEQGAHVPEEHREAARLVCAHLVSVRGGALFLSNADALRLLGWLDAGVPVPRILVAIDLAWQRRQQKRSRVPLTLGQANRYLGKPSPGAFRDDVHHAADVGLGPLLRRIRDTADGGDPAGAALLALADSLESLPADDAQRTAAMARVTAFHTSLWQDLPPHRQQAAREEAAASLGDLVHMLDEATLGTLIEEAAIGVARRGYAWLSVASVQDLLGAPT